MSLDKDNKPEEVQLDIKAVLELILLGIENGKYQATLNLIQACLEKIRIKDIEIKKS